MLDARYQRSVAARAQTSIQVTVYRYRPQPIGTAQLLTNCALFRAVILWYILHGHHRPSPRRFCRKILHMDQKAGYPQMWEEKSGKG